MDLVKARSLVDHYMKRHNLHVEWEFRFDHGKKRFGRCAIRGSVKTISLSKHLTLLNSCKRVLETLLHEIAHALVGLGNKHNEIWAHKCRELGTRDERYYSLANTIQPKKIKTF